MKPGAGIEMKEGEREREKRHYNVHPVREARRAHTHSHRSGTGRSRGQRYIARIQARAVREEKKNHINLSRAISQWKALSGFGAKQIAGFRTAQAERERECMK